MEARRVCGPMQWMTVAALWAFSAVAPAAIAQTVTYSGSAQYASGEYIFSERTHSVYLSNGLNVTGSRLNLSVSLPVIFQSSPWISYSVAGSIPSGGPQQRAVGGGKSAGGGGSDGQGDGSKAWSGHMSNGVGPGGGNAGSGTGRQPGQTLVLPDTASYASVGVGDPSARLDIDLFQDGPSPLGIRLAAGVKAPIADVDRGFGTGAWDTGLGLALSKRVGSWFFFGEAMHWWLGDMTEVVLDNSVAYSASIGRSLAGGKVGLLASLSGYASEVIENVEPPLQAGLGVGYNMAQGRYGLNGSVALGLVESTPDISIAVGWHVRL